MAERTYLNFDVSLQPAAAGGYQARVVSGPTGEVGPVPVAIPHSGLEIENFLLRIGRPRRGLTRSLQSPEASAVRSFGGALFDAVFRDQLRTALRSSLDAAEAAGAGLRVRLRLTDSPELVDLPWEYLYDRDAHRFLALSEWTPLVRYLELPGRVRPLAVEPPMRLLVMVASPTDLPALDVDREWTKLHEALDPLEAAGRVRVDRVPSGTLADLQRQLRRDEYHVFHYIGHGMYDDNAGDGVLAFEGPQRRGQLVSGTDLGALLHDHRTLRLVLLNSCEGARSGRADPYSGTAQSLVRQGIPAVVAMQFEITDEAAITLAHSLYEAVADGYPLDAAVAEARKAVKNQPNPVEWGTPVLYLRAEDPRVFDLPAAAIMSASAEPVAAEAGRVGEPVAPEAGRVGEPAAPEAGRVGEPAAPEAGRAAAQATTSAADAHGTEHGIPASAAALNAGGPADQPGDGSAAPDLVTSRQAAATARAAADRGVALEDGPHRGRRVTAAVLIGVAVVAVVVLGVLWVRRPVVTTVDVPGNQAWADTRVTCEPGRVLDISASGTVLHSPSSTSGVGPEGSTDLTLRQFNRPGLADVNHAALVGSFDRSQPFFVVGQGRSIACPGNGGLFLGVNDVGVENNGGQFVATITARRS